MQSNAQLSVQAVKRFAEWQIEREQAGDWSEYIRGGKLNRSELAKECGFGRAAIQQNPGLSQALATLEARLAQQGVLSAISLLAQEVSPELRAEVGATEERVRRELSARAKLEKRVKSLEEQNATLRSENSELRERVRRVAIAEQHLAQTGRTLPP